MCMAHFPRWIDHPGVDSAAMLTAFLNWAETAPPEEQLEVECLYTVNHAMDMMGVQHLKPRLPTGVGMRSVQCNAANCRRCTNLYGGYQFRWYDSRWVDAYNRGRRKGAVSLPLASTSGR